MFNRILSSVAVSPSTLNKFASFSEKLRKEKTVRKLGLYFILTGMFVQLFVLILPPEKSQLYSDSNTINGINTKQDILSEWDRQSSDIPEIYSRFGVTRQDIINLPTKPNTTLAITSDSNYWMADLNALSGSSEIKKQELAINTDGPVVYLKPLNSFEQTISHTYSAFKGRNSTTGQPFWILSNSGNYVQLGKNLKNEPPKKPELQIKKTILSSSGAFNSGGIMSVKVEYRNKIPDTLAESATIEDFLDSTIFDVITSPNLKIDTSGRYTYSAGNLMFTSYSKSLTITAKLKHTVINPDDLCAPATIKASNAGQVSSASTDCVLFTNTSPTGIGSTPPQSPAANMSELTGTLATSSETSTVINDTPPSNMLEAKIIYKNDTKNEAIHTTLSAGDIVEYTLKTSNTNSSTVENYTIKSYIGDVLDYGIIDTNSLKSEGGYVDGATHEVVWEKQSIPPASDLVKIVRITIKNPIPSTNRPSELSSNYDCAIGMLYGEETNYKIDCPTVKNIERAPNISAPSAIIISLSALLVSCYFSLRSRIFFKEASILKRIYQRNGQI